MCHLNLCSFVGNLTAQEKLLKNCLPPMSELCRYPQKLRFVGTLPTPHGQVFIVPRSKVSKSKTNVMSQRMLVASDAS